jgi:hypothetical protein
MKTFLAAALLTLSTGAQAICLSSNNYNGHGQMFSCMQAEHEQQNQERAIQEQDRRQDALDRRLDQIERAKDWETSRSAARSIGQAQAICDQVESSGTYGNVEPSEAQAICARYRERMDQIDARRYRY